MSIKLTQGLRLRKMGRRFMIVRAAEESVDLAEVIVLNETAAFVWKKASEVSEFDENQAVEWLLEEYDVDRETAAADVRGTIAQWKEYGIVE